MADPIPYGYCQCGCGGKTNLSPRNWLARGLMKGEPYDCLVGHKRSDCTPRSLEDHYRVDPDTGCWLWTGAVSVKGYGIKRVGRQMMIAHRWVWDQVREPIPEGLELDHLCHTNDKTCAGGRTCLHRRCVNPDHLEPVTRFENIQRGKDSARAAIGLQVEGSCAFRKDRKLWRAQLRVDGHYVHVGYFKTREEGVAAINSAAGV